MWMTSIESRWARNSQVWRRSLSIWMFCMLRSERGPLITTEIVVAEADYLILRRLGIAAELAFLDDFADRVFEVVCLTQR